ncbi:MAG: hypothetical protein ACK5QT_02670 [Oligoflexia bacterium]
MVIAVFAAFLASVPGRAEVLGTFGEGWVEINGDLKTLHLKGSEKEMGRQYGFLVGDEILDTLNALRESAIKEEPKTRYLPSWAFRGLRRVIGWVWWFTFPKNIKEHIDGIIEGARLRPDRVKLTRGDLAFFNSIIELAALFNASADSIESQVPPAQRLLQVLGLGSIRVNCDSFAAWGSRTVDGKTFQTRNVDIPTGLGLEKHPLVIIYKPTGKIPFATAAVSGVVGMFTGLNAHGVGMGQIWAFSTKIGVTQPWHLQMREVMMHSRTASEARDRMLKYKKLAYGSNFVLAGAGPNDGYVIEGNSERMEWFSSNDPRESELKYNGQSVNIPLSEVVFRGDVSFAPSIRRHQTAANGPGGDPRQAVSYKKRYQGQSDLILEYEAQGIKIGKEQAERISRDTAMRSGSFQVAVYGNTDLEMWVAYSRINDDGTVTQAYEREYQHVPFFRYLLDRQPETALFEIRTYREGRLIEAGQIARGPVALQAAIQTARDRASSGDWVEVLDAEGRRLELFAVAHSR